MWHWYNIRAQELIRERVAEADAWREAKAVMAARKQAAPRRASRPEMRPSPAER